MKNKIIATLNLGKIDKKRIVERSYTDKSGKTVTVKEYKVELIPLKEEKLVKSGQGWNMMKTHFIADAPTKEEKQNKIKMNTIGDGIQFVSLDAPVKEIPYPQENISPDDIPF